MAVKGGSKTGGRKKGTPNKSTAQIKALAQNKGPAALKKLETLLDSPDERVALAAANSLLDRGYGRPAQALELSGEVVITKIETTIVDPKNRGR